MEEYSHQLKTLNPEWTASEGVPHTLAHVTASDPRTFLVHIFDWNNHQADRFMGWCFVPLAHVFSLPFGAKGWVEEGWKPQLRNTLLQPLAQPFAPTLHQATTRCT